METSKFQLTQAGIDKYKEELERLKTIDRAENLEALKEARAQGDLSENADYDAAREEQARIEGRIKEIENILKNVDLIVENAGKIVSIGKTVQLKINGKEPQDYTVVGSLEANPFEKKISNESPIGKAIIGLKEKDSKEVKTEANKVVQVTVVKVY
jgi:transcription elongation factor GreA